MAEDLLQQPTRVDLASWISKSTLKVRSFQKTESNGRDGHNVPGRPRDARSFRKGRRAPPRGIRPARAGGPATARPRTRPPTCGICAKRRRSSTSAACQVGKPQAHRFPIEELFISLTTSVRGGRQTVPGGGPAGERQGESERTPPGRRALPLHAALQHDRLVVVGDPGAGKTTFLRRVAHALCETELGIAPDAARSGWDWPTARFRSSSG